MVQFLIQQVQFCISKWSPLFEAWEIFSSDEIVSIWNDLLVNFGENLQLSLQKNTDFSLTNLKDV